MCVSFLSCTHSDGALTEVFLDKYAEKQLQIASTVAVVSNVQSPASEKERGKGNSMLGVVMLF